MTTATSTSMPSVYLNPYHNYDKSKVKTCMLHVTTSNKRAYTMMATNHDHDGQSNENVKN